jgi:rubrerythrin
MQPDENDIPDPDFFDEDCEDEPDYYYCNCCGYSCATDNAGWGCPRCTAIMEPYYF